MLGNFLRRSTDHKQHVNKKENVEIDSRDSSGGQGNYIQYVRSSWNVLEVTLSILNVGLFR